MRTPDRLLVGAFILGGLGCGSSRQAAVNDPARAMHGHVMISKRTAPFANYREVIQTVRDVEPEITAATPVIASEAYLVRSDETFVALSLIGGGPLDRLEPFRASGTVTGLGDGATPEVVIGHDFARVFHLAVGDEVLLALPADRPDELLERRRRFRVAGTYRIGRDWLEVRSAVTTVSAMQAMVGDGDSVHWIELSLADSARSSDLAHRIGGVLGAEYSVIEIDDEVVDVLR